MKRIVLARLTLTTCVVMLRAATARTSITLQTRSRSSDVARLGLWALLLTPITIVIHELGHFVVPLLSGLPAQLHATHVSGGAGLGRDASWLVALQAGGGPLMTVITGAAGAFFYLRDRRRHWSLAFAVAAVSRLFVAVAWLGLRLLLVALGQSYGAQPNFDEHVLAQALGVRPELTAVAAALFLCSTLYLLFRHIPRGRRFFYLVVLSAAIVISNILWRMLAPQVLASA